MKLLALASISVLMVLGLMGCSGDHAAPTGSRPLDFEVIGDDSPLDFETALAELSAMGIDVPDPVRADDPVLAGIDLDAAGERIRGCRMDDEGRMRFRRIVSHLHGQFQDLRRCMSQNDDPRLRRLAYGAGHAYRHGMRALEAHEPRTALRYFHQSNRVLNLANRLCHVNEDGGRP